MYGLVNAFCQGLKIGIERADDDPCMFRLILVKANEMAAIDGQYGSVLIKCISQNTFIIHRTVCIASFLNDQYIMPHLSQVIDTWDGEILV